MTTARPTANDPHPPRHAAAPNRSASECLARIPISDLPLDTSMGTLGLFALDAQTVRVRAGGRHEPVTRFGPLRVNRVAVDITARYARDQQGQWQLLHDAHPIVFRADSAQDPTPTIRQKVRETLGAAITAWAEANPLVLAAAQHAAYTRQIAEQEAEIYEVAERQRVHERRVAELELARERHAAHWAAHLDPDPATPATLASVASDGHAAHYIVWVQGKAVAWGAVSDLSGLPDDRVLEAVRAHLRDHDADLLARVAAWQITDYADTSGALDPPEVAHAAHLVGEVIGRQLGNLRQPVTAASAADLWAPRRLAHWVQAGDPPSLREALDLLADPAIVRAAGHAQILRALVDHATTTAERINAEVVARLVPPDPDTKETIRLIRQHLKHRSGRDWSVTRGRGTAAGWIAIHVAPSRRVDGAMTDADRQELARLLDLDLRRVQAQPGVSVASSTSHYREYITRAMGLTPTELGGQYWD